MKDLVFNIKDNEIEIFYVKKLLNRVTINKKVLFSLYNQDKISQADFKLNTPGNIINLKNILEENGIKDKKAKLILSMDGIITREVNVPLIKNKNLKKFIKYNIKEYFTINIEDYYFDYKITSRLYDDKDTYKLLLVAIPKEKFQEILDLIKCLRLKVKGVNIYPNCILNLYSKIKNESIAVFDVSDNKSSISIIRDGSLFLYSLINTDFQETNEEQFKDIIRNFIYFLNFYSSRNYGKKIDSIYLIGKYAEDPILYKVIAEEVDGEIRLGYDNNSVKFYDVNGENTYENAEVLGLYPFKKPIYNKEIDFKEIISKDKKSNFKDIVIASGVSLIIINFLCIYFFMGYISRKMDFYNTSKIDKVLSKYNYVESKINNLNKEQEELKEKKEILNDIKSDSFDYMKLFTDLKEGLPDFCRIKSISVEKENVNLTLEIIDKKTINAAKLVIAINEIGLFEPAEIEQLEMNDTVEEITLDLKIKK